MTDWYASFSIFYKFYFFFSANSFILWTNEVTTFSLFGDLLGIYYWCGWGDLCFEYWYSLSYAGNWVYYSGWSLTWGLNVHWLNYDFWFSTYFYNNVFYFLSFSLYNLSYIWSLDEFNDYFLDVLGLNVQSFIWIDSLTISFNS